MKQTPLKGRAAISNASSRFLEWQREKEPDCPESRTNVTHLHIAGAQSIITRNQSPDIPFNLSINPYRGCEHGCSYCYARPSHAWLDLSPGLDFESKIFYKPDAADLLRKELAKPRYRCEPIALGSNTDGWQPVERKLQLSRSILQVCLEARQPVAIITKSALILRDLDILSAMAQHNLVKVMVSIPTLDSSLARNMEPRAASPAKRLEVINALHQDDIPVGVLMAPIIPFLTDHEIENILQTVSDAGAESAAYILLRLPLEVEEIFSEWLVEHYPTKARHVLNRLRECRDGKLYDSRFGKRMTGQGMWADLLAKRFKKHCEKLGLNRHRILNTAGFSPPALNGQLSLF